MLADESGLVLEGKGSKMSANGKLLGFPVKASIASLLIVKALNIDFYTAQPVDVKNLSKSLYERKAKDKFFVVEHEGKSGGSAMAGVLGGAIGGAIHGALTAGKGDKNSGGAFTLSITLSGKDSESDVKKKHQEILVALEDSLKQMGITPPVIAEV